MKKSTLLRDSNELRYHHTAKERQQAPHMAEKNKKFWMEDAFKNAKGQLRKSLGAKAGKPIAASKLEKATESKNTKTKRRAVLAETARKVNKKR